MALRNRRLSFDISVTHAECSNCMLKRYSAICLLLDRHFRHGRFRCGGNVQFDHLRRDRRARPRCQRLLLRIDEYDARCIRRLASYAALHTETVPRHARCEEMDDVDYSRRFSTLRSHRQSALGDDHVPAGTSRTLIVLLPGPVGHRGHLRDVHRLPALHARSGLRLSTSVARAFPVPPGLLLSASVHVRVRLVDRRRDVRALHRRALSISIDSHLPAARGLRDQLDHRALLRAVHSARILHDEHRALVSADRRRLPSRLSRLRSRRLTTATGIRRSLPLQRPSIGADHDFQSSDHFHDVPRDQATQLPASEQWPANDGHQSAGQEQELVVDAHAVLSQSIRR